MRELAPGSVLSGFRIDAVVGRGGMGIVYRAQELALGRSVALKVIAPELLDDDSARERFLREARAAASIEHANVIPVLHAGDVDGVPYLVMRFVDGDDVRTLVRRAGPLAVERAARLAAQVGDGLDAIHGVGLVHRDVKPANVLVGAGDHVYVTDFGLAKHTVTRGGDTRSGHWVGTLDFVSPEQIRGEPVDARTDVYALGGVLFFMLTGAVPFSEYDGDEAKLWAHLTEPPQPLAERRDGLPATVDAVVARAMAKDPAARYPSAGDLGRAAVAAARDEDPSQPERVVAVGAAAPGGGAARPRPGVRPRPDAPTTDGGRPADGDSPVPATRRRRGRLLVGAALAAVAAAVVAAVVLLSGGSGPARPPVAGPVSRVRVGARIPDVGNRPNAIAVAGRTVWVSSAPRARVTRLDARTGRKLADAPVVGRTAVAMAPAGDGVWIALARPGRVVQLAPDGSRVGGSVRLPGNPTAIAAVRDAVWVAVRGGGGTPDVVLRFDAATRRLAGRVVVPLGARALAAAPGGVWIAHRATPTVVLLDARTGDERVSARLRQPAYALTYGAGHAWASLRTDDTIARIDPRNGAVVAIAAPRRPMQLAVAGNRVLVAGYVDHAVGVIDPEAARPVGPALPAGLNPFAVAGDGRHVWVTAVASNSVTRFDIG